MVPTRSSINSKSLPVGAPKHSGHGFRIPFWDGSSTGLAEGSWPFWIACLYLGTQLVLVPLFSEHNTTPPCPHWLPGGFPLATEPTGEVAIEDVSRVSGHHPKMGRAITLCKTPGQIEEVETGTLCTLAQSCREGDLSIKPIRYKVRKGTRSRSILLTP